MLKRSFPPFSPAAGYAAGAYLDVPAKAGQGAVPIGRATPTARAC